MDDTNRNVSLNIIVSESQGEQENLIIANTGAGAGAENQNHKTKTNTPPPPPRPIDEPMTECPICLDDYTAKSRTVTCSCGYTVHLSCVQEYLLHQTKEPHCMYCHKYWDRAFQYTHLTTTFVNGKYKKHRKQLLLEKEKARFPESMAYVETMKSRDSYANENLRYESEMSQLQAQIDILRGKILSNTGVIHAIDKRDYKALSRESISQERKVFMKPCPETDCRGFLSSGYKCGLCNTRVCSKCFEIKGKTTEECSTHICDENNVKNADAIKKETKPCPKCAVPIFKIVGCDQMWCTMCNVAFSWKTGKQETGIIHNPHYYEWVKKNGNATRNPGDYVCGGIPDYWSVITKLRQLGLIKYYSHYSGNSTRHERLLHIHRYNTEIQQYVLDRLRTQVREATDNTDLRLRYLMNEIDEAHLAKMITQRDNIREKNQAMLYVFELYIAVVTEFFDALMTSKTIADFQERFDAELAKLENIRVYCNEELVKISKNYKMTVYYITEEYSTVKMSLKSINQMLLEGKKSDCGAELVGGEDADGDAVEDGEKINEILHL